MSKQEDTNYWLMKSEPDVFSFEDLMAKKTTFWDGVRNYMARNYMMRDMKVGDLVLFYHSNAKPSGIAGIATISSEARPDASSFDKNSDYYDQKSTPDKPRWFAVDVSFYRTLPSFVSLDQVKKNKKLKKMVLLNNSRLSVQPVTKNEFDLILEMSQLGGT
ncbi:MAG: EVE domain-containing protein [Bdellovibrionales bacterium]|nr:EVE domain-containing protein [Bdellovibrionales bacterium]